MLANVSRQASTPRSANSLGMSDLPGIGSAGSAESGRERLSFRLGADTHSGRGRFCQSENTTHETGLGDQIIVELNELMKSPLRIFGFDTFTNLTRNRRGVVPSRRRGIKTVTSHFKQFVDGVEPGALLTTLGTRNTRLVHTRTRGKSFLG
jgi:hypothetical protein